jgi:glucose/arabinose dehydrogenase
MINLAIILILMFSAVPQCLAKPPAIVQSRDARFQLEELAAGLGVVWGMTFVGPDELLFTERQGKVKKLSPATGKIEEIAGAPEVWASGQGGLLDVAVQRDYAPGDWIYFTYSKPRGSGAATTLGRARLAGLQLRDWQDLLVTKAVSDSGNHFGSRIVFDGSGHLFFSVGDRGERTHAQDPTNHAGSILRLHLDGRVPADNPFAAGKGLAEIWSYGHRNPQGLVYDAANDRLWSIEHGPRGGDEINLVKPGRNYGWPVVSHGKEYWGPIQVGEGKRKPGMEDPVKVYIPSIAPGSLLLYTGNAFPKWRGNLFAGALVLQHLNRVVVNGAGQPVAEERLLADLEERIRALAESPEGWLYLSTDSGKIFRLRPADARN